MRNFKKLNVWQSSHKLVLKVYQITQFFSKEELFGLTSQMRRSFASISYNISEGAGRHSEKEFANFLNIALGSSNEAENQLILAKDLKYITNENFEILTEELIIVKKQLIVLRNKLITQNSSENKG